MGFRFALKFRKFKVALKLMNRIFFNFAKSCILFFLPKFSNKKNENHFVNFTWANFALTIHVYDF